MRILLIAGLVAAQAAGPAQAAEIVDETRPAVTRTGVFAGARIRIALDRHAAEGDRVRPALVAGPIARSDRTDGSSRLRFGSVLEYGEAADGRPALNLAGIPTRRIGQSGERAGVSTLGWVAIGVGALAATVVIASFICIESNCLGSE